MRVAYVSTHGSDDIAKWSGIGYFMFRALQRAPLDVRDVGPVRTGLGPLLKVARRLAGFGPKQLMYDREPIYLRRLARDATDRLSRFDYDVVFSPGTIAVAELQISRPIVFWTDATFDGMVDFYPHLTGLLARSVRHGQAMEQRAIARSAVAIYTSEWAANSAVRAYGADPDRVHVVPFGANLTVPVAEVVPQLIGQRSADTCELLFVGVDWHRKGGPEAVAVARRLNERGLPTTLTIVGCLPPRGTQLPPYVRVAGFVKKGGPGDRRLAEYLSQSHFFILPTRADATPVVFSEANAFGVPILATAVGGIPSIVRDNVNGRLFAPPPVDADDWSSYVLDVFSRRGYASLALTSRHEYERRLNWDVAGEAVGRLLETAAQAPRNH